MSSVTKADIGDAIIGMVDRFNAELYAKTDEQLLEHWHFKYDPKKRFDLTLYDFTEMLKLYSGFCRRWEEHHNGTCCVVERVRDKYILPKIHEFLMCVKAAEGESK